MRPSFTDIDLVEVLKLHQLPNIGVTNELGWRRAWRCCCAIVLADKKIQGVVSKQCFIQFLLKNSGVKQSIYCILAAKPPVCSGLCAHE